MRALIVVLVLLVAGWCYAGEKRQYEVSPRYPSFNGKYGVFGEPGSSGNPFEIKRDGQTIGTIRPKYPAIGGHQPKIFGPPGSDRNPWVIEVEE